MVFSAPFQSIRLPPPPGFIPPPVPARPTVISFLNPFSAVTKPSPNDKINTNNDLQTTTTTKSILREPGCYSVKNVSDRVVSFDLESSAITNTTMTKPINHAQGSLAPKCSNPSMPNLHYGCEKVSHKSKNPFLAGFLTDITANDSEHDSSESQSDEEDEDDFDDFESAENTDLVLSDTNTNHNNKTVKLGENFFASLFNNTSFTNKIPDPWPATKSTEATAAASANATAWPTMTTASGTPAGQPGPHGLSPMTPANPSAIQKSPTGSQSRPAESTAASVSVADRYSALKELDEIFKTTVTVSDGECFFSTNI